ncbi:MAG: aminotransferase class III, partial [bacterium]|nr:aminotransferase class III [bacterium]
PMGHFSFVDKNPLTLKALFVQLMLEQGFLASTSFYTMYAHQSEHVELYLKGVDKTFAQIADWLKKGEIEKFLKGAPSSAGFGRLT